MCPTLSIKEVIDFPSRKTVFPFLFSATIRLLANTKVSPEIQSMILCILSLYGSFWEERSGEVKQVGGCSTLDRNESELREGVPPSATPPNMGRSSWQGSDVKVKSWMSLTSIQLDTDQKNKDFPPLWLRGSPFFSALWVTPTYLRNV